ncbi:MAG: hypothetical protein MI975_26005 [Cytophagales bacterium]|nr:hypothetical protein [Cytophagales bacterium]
MKLYLAIQLNQQEKAHINKNWKGDILRIWGIIGNEYQTGKCHYYIMDRTPLTDHISPDSYDWPLVSGFDCNALEPRLANWKNHAIQCSGGSVFQHATYLRGMDSLMMDMMIDIEKAEYILDRFSEFYYTFFENIFKSSGHLIDIFALADDLAAQNNLMISPDMFEQYVAPRIKRMADLAHQYDIKLLLHTDGNVRSLIPRFIELGVDILDPIQPEADEMDPISIKHEFGRDICLRGGISAQKIMAHGSKSDVRDETRRILDELAPGGGYILSPGHPVLQDDISIENIITMYETGLEYFQ